MCWCRHVKLARPELLDVVEGLVTTKSWWDTVDALASNVVGPLVRRYPPLVATLDEWIAGDELWLARTAILHQLRTRTTPMSIDCSGTRSPGQGAPTSSPARRSGGRCANTPGPIPTRLRRFVAEHDDVLSPLTVREASKHL